MAIQHVKAVMKQSKLTNPKARQALIAVASHIGNDDQPAFPSLREIAKYVPGANKDTVSGLLNEAVQIGELTTEKQGRKTYYRLNEQAFDWSCENDNTVSDQPQIKYATEQFVEQCLSKLQSELMSSLSTDLSSLSNSLSSLSSLVSSMSSLPEGALDLSIRSNKKRREEEEDRHPQSAIIHPNNQQIFDLVVQWGSLLGVMIKPEDKNYNADHALPAASLLRRPEVMCDVSIAARMVQDKRFAMLQDGKTPKRLSAVVPKIIDELDGYVAKNGKSNGYHQSDDLSGGWDNVMD